MIINEQIKIVNFAKKKISLAKENLNNSNSIFCWFTNIPETLGYILIKKNFQKKILTLGDYLIILKVFLGVANLHNFKVLNNFKNNFTFKKIIITWGSKNNFKKDGSLNDRCFGINSKKYKNFLWIVIYDSNSIPNKVDRNIILFGKKNYNYKYNFFYFFRILLLKFVQRKFKLSNFFYYFSYNSIYAEIFENKILKLIDINKLSSVAMAYEGQPFQNNFFQTIKKLNPKIKTTGYLQSAQSLPLNCIARSGKPDYILTHSSDQAYHLSKYLSWPKKKIRIINSLRYKQKEFIKLSNSILFPYSFSAFDCLKNEYTNFIKQVPNYSLNKLKILQHPFSNNPKMSLKLFKEIKKINIRFKKKFSQIKKNNITVVFGSSSAVLLALESGLQVIHICENAPLESYSNAFWPSIKINQISKNLFIYKLKIRGKCINFGNSNKDFDRLLYKVY
jgi:hypothetical protein